MKLSFINKVREEHVRFSAQLTQAVRNQGNQPLDINTADLPPSSRRLSSIWWHHLPLHLRLNISVQTTRPMLGIFCRPQDRLFLLYFYFHLFFTRHGRRAPCFVTTADLCSTSHTLSSAGRRSQQQAFNEPGPRPSFHRSKPHSLRASAPQPSPRLSQLQRKYAAGPLASIFRC